jgi:homocysteine S-methyltransferase
MRPGQSIIETLRSQVVIFDGAIGTEIYRQDVFVNQCFDDLNVGRPELIRGIHRSYAEAGAEVMTANTYGANRVELGKFGLAERLREINEAGVRIAREVADAAAQPVYVAGSVGPLLAFNSGTPYDPVAVIAEQIAVLVSAGVDFILFETQPNRLAVETCVEALRRTAPKFPFMVSVVPPNLETGGDWSALASALAPLPDSFPQPFAWGLNCGMGPDLMLPATEQAMKLVATPLVVQPNAGEPRTVGGRQLYLCSPEYFSSYARRLLELGVRGVGGCCGTTPAHIREAARMLKPLARTTFQVHEMALAPIADKPPPPLAERSRLGAKLAAGQWVRTVEIVPPAGHDLSQTIAKARLCREAGIDAINVPDGPRASARISPFFTALRIQEQAGIEAILHVCGRDRNLIGIQADLLACAGGGVRNLLFVTGDPPKLGKYPFATAVFDVDSIGLVGLQSRLNRGQDLAGQEIAPAAQAVIGVGADPNALDLEREIRRLREKAAAGAEFIVTQPIFDAEVLLRFLDRCSDLRLPVLAGVWPLASYRNATFMKNEVPGVVVPDWVMDKMASAEDREGQRQLGIEIARETVAQLRGRIAGIQVSAPFGNVNTALAVLGE